MAYPNGQVPASARTVIDDAGRTLLTPAALAWAWVCDEVERRYGWRPTLSAGLTAYRTLDEQVRVLRDNYDHTWRPGLTVGNGGVRSYDGRTWYRRPGKSTAAEPGTSKHGFARAVDVAGLGDEVTDTRYRQFADVATEMGWSNTEGLSIAELWHWVHDGVTVPRVVPEFAPPTERPAMTRKYLRTSEPFTIAKAGHWYQLPVGDTDKQTKKRPRSALAGVDRCDFDAELRLAVTGLPAGATVQVRYVQMPAGKDASDVRYAVDEVIGTAGGTYARTGCKGSLAKGKRLVILVQAATPGVRVTSVQSRVDYWKP